MSALFECLNQLPGFRLGTVVHVNPVDGDAIDHYARHGASRIVLVSADPAVLPALQREAKGRAGISVLEAAVAPQACEAQWLRFNVRELNGLQRAGKGLLELYPRLRVIEQFPVVTATLQSMLAPMVPMLPTTGTNNLLVLETPGLESAILEGLSQEVLEAFDLILLRGAGAGLFENGTATEVAIQWLEDRYFRPASSFKATDNLWPVVLMCHDRQAAAQAVLVRQIDDLRTQVEHLSKARDEQAKAAAERQARIMALVEAHRHVDQLAQERLAQIDQLTAAHNQQTLDKAQAEARAQDRLAQFEAVSKTRDEQARRIAQLEAELVDLTARQGLLREELIKAEAHVELISDLLLWEKAR